MEAASTLSSAQAVVVAVGLATQQETVVREGMAQYMAAAAAAVDAAAGYQEQADKPTHQGRAETENKALSL